MRRESPVRRRNPSGKVVWVARYRGRNGKHRIAKPTWNRGKGSFDRKADAQRAIDEAYGLSDRPDTLGAYLDVDRSPSTVGANERDQRASDRPPGRRGGRGDRVEGLAAARVAPPPRVLVDHMLKTEGRATTGAVGILRALSGDGRGRDHGRNLRPHPFKGVRFRASDSRAEKKRRPIRVFSFEEMHCFAKAAGRYEALVRTFADTGMRLGEVLPLRAEDFDGETLQVRRTAHEGAILEGTKTDHDEEGAGRVVPVPATLAWMLEAQINLNGPGCKLIFTTPRGRMWRERNFYRDVWEPPQEASGLDIRPHECRHSYVTQLRAAGIDDADLAG
jgi:integrase